MEQVIKHEISKEDRWNKFLVEHPSWKTYDKSRLLAMENREKKLALRLKRIEEILELRFKNEETVADIAKKYGVTRQRISQIIIDNTKKESKVS